MLRYVTYDSRYLEFLINYDHRVRTAAKWVRMLRYSSHLSVRGYCDSSPNKVDVGFPAETTLLFSRKFAFWWGHDKKRQGDERCNELRNHVTNALLRSLTLQLLTQYFLFLSEIRDRGVRRKLSWKRQLCLFWFRLIPTEWNQTMRISKVPLLRLDGVTMEMLSFSFLYAYEISRALLACVLILPLCPEWVSCVAYA